jgi:hypothetical protein
MTEKKCNEWPLLSLEAVNDMLVSRPLWTLVAVPNTTTNTTTSTTTDVVWKLSRKFLAKNFMAAIAFINEAAKVLLPLLLLPLLLSLPLLILILLLFR